MKEILRRKKQADSPANKTSGDRTRFNEIVETLFTTVALGHCVAARRAENANIMATIAPSAAKISRWLSSKLVATATTVSSKRLALATVAAYERITNKQEA